MKTEIIDNCNINKTTISRVLTPWTASPGNELRKKEAVTIAMQILLGKYHLDQCRLFTETYGNPSSFKEWRVNRVTSTISELGAGDEVLKIYDFSNFVIDPSV
jgi:hypothetical protein